MPKLQTRLYRPQTVPNRRWPVNIEESSRSPLMALALRASALCVPIDTITKSRQKSFSESRRMVTGPSLVNSMAIMA